MIEQPERSDAAALDTRSLPSTSAVAVTPHHLASEAAIALMSAGGNAVDAAIASNAVLGVVAPDTCGIGGDLFALIHAPDDKEPSALNASGHCGTGWSAENLRQAGLDHIPVDSVASITVPGCVDGWIALTERYGTRSLAVLLEPAIELAENGFAVSRELSESLVRLQHSIGAQPSAVALYPDQAPPATGDIVRRPDLATTLEEVARSGRDGFYAGRVGAAITEATEAGLAPVDLEQAQAGWTEPIGTHVFGHEAWTVPPNSQGYLTLAAAWVFEQLDVTRDPDDPEYQHALIEAYRSVAWERDHLVSDPGTVPLHQDALLDPDRLRERVDRISGDEPADWPEPTSAPGGTAYFCVRDGNGMGVSFIQSNFHGIGSRISAGDTGVFLHNRGAGFNLIPGHPNELTPGRRPLHTLSPTLWTKAGSLRLLLGTRGGQYQPQTLLQIAANELWAGLDAADTQSRPRWQVDGWQASNQPQVVAESRFARRTLDGLRRRGHTVAAAGPWMAGWGPVSMIGDRASRVRGVADPRVTTTSALAT